MSDISKIKDLSGTTYDLKDAAARSGSARDDTKLPLSGGTLTGELKSTALYADRSLCIDGGRIRINMPANYGAGAGLQFFASDGKTLKGLYGYYNFPSDSSKNYFYCGEGYSNPNGTLKAGTFVGALTGNADSATSFGSVLYNDSTGAAAVTLSESITNFDYLLVNISGVGAGIITITLPAIVGYSNSILATHPIPTSSSIAAGFVTALFNIKDTSLNISLGSTAFTINSSATISATSAPTAVIKKVTGYKNVT